MSASIASGEIAIADAFAALVEVFRLDEAGNWRGDAAEGQRSGQDTNVIAADVLVAPLLSVATAVSAKLPTSGAVHVKSNGGAASTPMSAVPAKNATLTAP